MKYNFHKFCVDLNSAGNGIAFSGVAAEALSAVQLSTEIAVKGGLIIAGGLCVKGLGHYLDWMAAEPNPDHFLVAKPEDKRTCKWTAGLIAAALDGVGIYAIAETGKPVVSILCGITSVVFGHTAWLNRETGLPTDQVSKAQLQTTP